MEDITRSFVIFYIMKEIASERFTNISISFLISLSQTIKYMNIVIGILKYATTHNHVQPSTTTHNNPQLSTTTQNHPKQPQPSATTHKHPQLFTTTHNHPEPPKNYPKKPKLVTNCTLDVNTKTDVDFDSDMKQ